MDVALDGRPVATRARAATIETTRRAEQGQSAPSRDKVGLSLFDSVRVKRHRRNAHRGNSG